MSGSTREVGSHMAKNLIVFNFAYAGIFIESVC